MNSYANKKAVITGGTIGMGLAMARALLAAGADVLLTGRNEQNLDSARRELGSEAHVVRSDTASIADIDALGGLVEEKLGEIDAVFINAGVARLGTFAEVTEEVYDEIFNVNAKGAYFTVQRLAPLVRSGGSFVFTTVTDGNASAGMSVYLGSKAALRAFAGAFAAELVPRGIRVNTVAPGFTDTPTMGTPGVSDDEIEAFRQLGKELTPMKRLGSPEEVARAALFLAFDATYSTGVEVPVDGGLSRVDAPPPVEEVAS